jgi:hypothetical protein
MSNVPVAVSLSGGNVSIMRFVTQGRGSILPDGAVWVSDGQWSREANSTNIFSEISRAFVNDTVTSYRVVLESDIPQERDYRDSVRDTGTALVYDMPTARELHMALIRHERARQFEQLDRDWMKYFAQGNSTQAAAVEAQRQTLRDRPQVIQPDVDAAQTVDALKLITL